MSDPESPAFSRVCPECGRRVPSKVATCRCGYVLGEAAETIGPEDARLESNGEVPQPSARGHLAQTFATVVVALAAVLGAFYWTNRQTKAPAAHAIAGVRVAPTVSGRAAAGGGLPSFGPAAAISVPTPDASPSEPAGTAPAAAAPSLAFTGSPLPLEDVISRTMPAVVRVETPTGLGTGFFVAPDTILTNVHVVAGNASVTIRRPDGATLSARVDVTAPELDIAVMHISNPDPKQRTLTLGSGKQARAGQEVIALGTPLGLQNTVTRGIVSAVRDVGAVTLVQTDAAINPGNSGGPLLDRAGLVIGITTMGMRSAVAQGLSFAVAIEHAKDLLAGNRSAATGTPAASLNEAMSGRPAHPEGETLRDQATKAYEQVVATLAQKADALDSRWLGFKRVCYQGRIVGAFGHEWFALWDPRAMQGAVAPGCEASFADIRRMADDIHAAVLGADEAARQADVYPGTRRDVLRRYRLDYNGWNR